MKKTNLNKYKVSIFFVVAVVALIVIYKICFVSFKDKTMARVIAIYLDKPNSYFITRKDLNRITHISIGPTYNYDTIIDLAKCSNLEVLTINNYGVFRDYYLRDLNKKEDVEDGNKTNQIQNDLEIIFEQCPHIRTFIVERTYSRDFSMDESRKKMYIQFTDISFLKNARNLEILFLENQDNISDYSVLSDLSNIKEISLRDSNISDIEGILQLDSLEYLNIIGTPAQEKMGEDWRFGK